MKETALNPSHLPLIEAHVRKLYSRLPEKYHYHTLGHTLTVVKAAKEIAVGEGLSEHEQLIVEVAGWFHDVGYAKSNVGHEELSSFRSMLTLVKLGISYDDMELIEGCILVTQLGSEPKSNLQAVLCDSDMYHLACDDFWEWSMRLRMEWEATGQATMNDVDWLKNNIKFMRTVNFRTEYGRARLYPRLQANIAKLEEMLQRSEL
ncbi:MAG: HD domain-containing protein [Flavobacteriales bacterium]|nr:HD domain-containing protein [Flavobacteriales bacterium]